MEIEFTLCFIKHNEKFLMLYREKPPNQYLWNGVGGKIEGNEKPEEAIKREIKEETQLHITDVQCRGIVSWNDVGAMYVFIAESDSEHVIDSDEGHLQWKSLDWVLTSDEVVSNIRIFLPYMLDDNHPPAYFSFTYNEEGEITSYDVMPIDEQVSQLV